MQKNVLAKDFLPIFFLWMTYHRQAFDKTMNENGYLLSFHSLSKASSCSMPQDTVNI
jgi:hypothetical protein